MANNWIRSYEHIAAETKRSLFPHDDREKKTRLTDKKKKKRFCRAAKLCLTMIKTGSNLASDLPRWAQVRLSYFCTVT